MILTYLIPNDTSTTAALVNYDVTSLEENWRRHYVVPADDVNRLELVNSNDSIILVGTAWNYLSRNLFQGTQVFIFYLNFDLKGSFLSDRFYGDNFWQFYIAQGTMSRNEANYLIYQKLNRFSLFQFESMNNGSTMITRID